MDRFGKFRDVVNTYRKQAEDDLNHVKDSLIALRYDTPNLEAKKNQLESEADKFYQQILRADVFDHHLGNCPRCFIQHNHLRQLTSQPFYCWQCQHEKRRQVSLSVEAVEKVPDAPE